MKIPLGKIKMMQTTDEPYHIDVRLRIDSDQWKNFDLIGLTAYVEFDEDKPEPEGGDDFPGLAPKTVIR